jgi:hypothetical protein
VIVSISWVSDIRILQQHNWLISLASWHDSRDLVQDTHQLPRIGPVACQCFYLLVISRRCQKLDYILPRGTMIDELRIG